MLVLVGKQTFEIEDVIREAIPGDLLSLWLRYLQSKEGEAFRNYLPSSPFPNQSLKVSKLKYLSFLPPSPKPKPKKKKGVTCSKTKILRIADGNETGTKKANLSSVLYCTKQKW